ncbi:MAG: thioesterase family protein [Rhizobiales bacterium]|nr:thioesterase family protein [Hyphomicrobiales bacterium]MBI3672246.1 thioesterase family protein [Hyphomicrobiales bacterium]
MEFQAPFQGSIQAVEDQWIDYNGHFNMAYYNVIFDRCGDEAFALLGLGPDYVKERNRSFFTLEAHVTYLRELHAGDRVRVTVQLLDHDAKRVHYVQEMFHAEEGWLACVTENIVMHVDMTAKKSAPFPPDVLARIAAMEMAHGALPVPSQVGHRIGIPRKDAVAKTL